jgi:hypothetical protein
MWGVAAVEHVDVLLAPIKPQDAPFIYIAKIRGKGDPVVINHLPRSRSAEDCREPWFYSWMKWITQGPSKSQLLGGSELRPLHPPRLQFACVATDLFAPPTGNSVPYTRHATVVSA